MQNAEKIKYDFFTLRVVRPQLRLERNAIDTSQEMNTIEAGKQQLNVIDISQKMSMLEADKLQLWLYKHHKK